MYILLYVSKVTFYKNKIVPWRKQVKRGNTECQFREGRAADLSGVVREVSLRRWYLGKTPGSWASGHENIWGKTVEM